VKKLTKNKKGLSLSDLPQIAMVFLLVGIFFAIGLVILTSMQNAGGTIDANSAANGAVTKARTALSEIPSNWLLLIAVVIAAAVIISVVMQSFKGGNQ
jgi:preprotein translocase subunit SecG